MSKISIWINVFSVIVLSPLWGTTMVIETMTYWWKALVFAELQTGCLWRHSREKSQAALWKNQSIPTYYQEMETEIFFIVNSSGIIIVQFIRVI